MKPLFFSTPGRFRAWLRRHHDSHDELLVGFYKVGSGRPSMTWPESVDEALCFGWIDGVRRSLDEESYTIRFTPRRPGSTWSAVNIRKVEALISAGRMEAPGLARWKEREEGNSRIYSYEQRRGATLEGDALEAIQSVPNAWAYFQSQPPWYRRTASFWVTSARKPETRQRRLETLIADSAAGRPIKPLARPARRKK